MNAATVSSWYDPRTILVATNLADGPALLLHGAAHANRSGARLLLVHVVPPPQTLAVEGRAQPSPSLPSARAARNALEQLALQLQWQGILCEPVVVEGSPVEQIAALVRSRRVDRVLVAPRRVSLTQDTARPSVAETLIATLDVPVFVIGRNVYPTSFADHPDGRILLALSLRSDRPDYLDFACGFALERRARLTLLHVLDVSGLNESQREQSRIHARTRLAALAASETGLSCTPDIAIREGDPARGIIDEGVCPSRDFIILGSSSLSPHSWGRGAHIVHRVIAEARCPVITLKPIAASGIRSMPVRPESRTGTLG